MADTKAPIPSDDKKSKEDIYSLTTPAGAPAYPQVIYVETGEKYKDGSPILKELGIAKDPEEHKKLLDVKKPAWDK